MKKIIVLLLVLTTFVTTWSFAKHFWRGEVINSAEVKKRWGKTPLDETKFKAGNSSVRAPMAFALMKTAKSYVGKDRTEIEQKFGRPDGFYFSDMFPAYMIQRGKEVGEDSWQIVFLLDREQKVSEIVVHKNCCEK